MDNKPAKPTNLSSQPYCSSSNSKVQVSWEYDTSSGKPVDHFDVFVDSTKQSVGASARSATFSDLIAEQNYNFKVVAVGVKGLTTESDISSFTALKCEQAVEWGWGKSTTEQILAEIDRVAGGETFVYRGVTYDKPRVTKGIFCAESTWGLRQVGAAGENGILHYLPSTWTRLLVERGHAPQYHLDVDSGSRTSPYWKVYDDIKDNNIWDPFAQVDAFDLIIQGDPTRAGEWTTFTGGAWQSCLQPYGL